MLLPIYNQAAGLEAMTLTVLGGVAGVISGIAIALLIQFLAPSLKASISVGAITAGGEVSIAARLGDAGGEPRLELTVSDTGAGALPQDFARNRIACRAMRLKRFKSHAFSPSPRAARTATAFGLPQRA